VRQVWPKIQGLGFRGQELGWPLLRALAECVVGHGRIYIYGEYMVIYGPGLGPEFARSEDRELSLIGRRRASCQAQDLQPFFKMVASVLAGSVGMSDFCAAHDWHTLGKCSHENPIRLPLFCRATLISANQH
jgi:hypothetical protein